MSAKNKRKASAGKAVRQRNFVQAHVMDATVPQIFVDRRRRERCGYRKHKRSFAQEAFAGGTRKAFFMSAA